MLNKGKSSRNDSKKRNSRSILIGTLTAAFIAITPYLFYSYEYFPKGPILETWLFTYESIYQESVSIAMWIYMGKLVPLALLILWFFTCKHWWYHIILIPALMYAFQIFEGVISDDKYIDSENILWLLPFCMIVVPIVYFIRIKLYDKHVNGIDLEAMEAELAALKKKQADRSKDKKLDKFISSETSNKPKGYQSMSDKIETKLSTHNIESTIKQFQHRLTNWLHLKF